MSEQVRKSQKRGTELQDKCFRVWKSHCVLELAGVLFRLLVRLLRLFNHLSTNIIPIPRDIQEATCLKSHKEAKDSVRSELRECQVALGFEFPRDA